MPRQPRNPTHTQLAIGQAVEPPDTRPRVPRIALWLPFPPSVNHVYRTFTANGRAMVTMTKVGHRYKEAVAKTFEANLGNARPPAPYYALTLRAFPPDRRKHDVDNMLKVLIDAIFAAIGANDNDLIDLHITKPPPDEQPDGSPRVEMVLEGGA